MSAMSIIAWWAAFTMPEQYQRLPLWKCGTKYPCITLLKYRPKNPRLYFSEIKPLGLIHIQSLVTRRAAGLYNLVPAAVIGKSCFVLVSCKIGTRIRSGWLTYIWPSALSAQSKTKGSPLTCSGAKWSRRSLCDHVWSGSGSSALSGKVFRARSTQMMHSWSVTFIHCRQNSFSHIIGAKKCGDASFTPRVSNQFFFFSTLEFRI